MGGHPWSGVGLPLLELWKGVESIEYLYFFAFFKSNLILAQETEKQTDSVVADINSLDWPALGR